MKEINVEVNGAHKEYTVAEAKAQGINRWKDWYCEIGALTLYIDFDGQVWRGPCKVGGPIGHMLGSWKSITDMVTCTRDTCDCGTGIKVYKYRETDIGEGIDRVTPTQNQPVQIQWDLGRRCNFDCSYCWPSSHNKTDEWVPVAALKKVVDRALYEWDDARIQFNFAGGEPTLHPGFIELCEHIWERGHDIHVQTNGSMNVKKAERLSTMAELSISVHFEFVKPDKLLKNITAILAGPNQGLEVKLMLDRKPWSLSTMWNLKQLLANVPNIERARVIVSPLRDPVTNDLMSYTELELKEFGDVEF